MSEYWEQPPYSMIGYQSTLPSKSRKAGKPIGFIWPKKQKSKKAKRK